MSPSCNLFSHLFIVAIGLWVSIFFPLDNNPILLYFGSQIVPILALIRRSFRWFLCPFDVPLSYGVWFWDFFFLQHFLTFWHSKIFQARRVCVFPALLLEAAISPRSSAWFLSLETTLRDQDSRCAGFWVLSAVRGRK